MRTGMLLLVVLLAAGACAGGDDAPAGSDATVIDEDETPADVERLDGELRYARSGGIAGIREELVIQADGNATATFDDGAAQSFALSGDDLERLRALLDDTDFDVLAAAAAEEGRVDDDFVYELRYQEKDLSIEGSNLPDPYPPLFIELDRLLDEAAG